MRDAKASHFERLPRPGEVARKCQKGARWHGEAVTERARMLTKSKKHSDTSPVCQRHRIAALSCFILPGLPSQALARQISQRESPWQRGFVFDETDLRLPENVTECQSLSLWERWHCEAMTERARMLTKGKNTAIQALFVRDIVSLCFRVLFCRACPLRRWRASSPKGRALGKEVTPSCTPPCRGRQADSTPSG